MTNLGWLEPHSLHVVGRMWVNGQLGPRRLRESLTVRALRRREAGQVTGWKIQQRLASRQRGYYFQFAPQG